MIPWSKYPFIRILLPLSAGILLCYFIRFVHIQFGVIIPLAALIILISFNSILADKLSYGFRWLTGLLFNLTIVIIGYCMMANTFLENLPDHFSNLPVKAEAYIAKTTSNPQSAKKYYKVPILITAINSNGKIIPCTGRVMCYISNRNSKILKLEYGDIIIFKKEVKRPEDPDCPWDFNYKSYLENNNIYHLTYLKPDEFRIISHGNGNYVKSFAIHTRDKLLSIIHQCGLSGEEFAVASAFLAGYDNEISNELYDAYSGAGVIHILSVSGLHVGIIFMMAQAFFSFFYRFRKFSFLEPVSIIAVVWLYALITGLAPPVLRASLMFTLILIGKATRRQFNTLNTLAAAAFILLIFEPRILFDVGFQLSFSAVAGIVILQPFFKNLWWPQNPLVKNVWGLITVSLAAQIFTLPFVLYYFHRFPTYFLLTNLLAIPLSGMIMYTGVFLLFTSFIPHINNFVGLVLKYEIKSLNFIVRYCDNLPGATIDKINLSITSTLLLMGLLVFLMVFLLTRKKQFLWISLVCLLGLSTAYALRTYTIENQIKIIFHKAAYHPLISFIKGREHTILTDSLVLHDLTVVNFQLKGLMINAGLNNPSIKCFSWRSPSAKEEDIILPEFYSFHNRRIVVVSNHCLLPLGKYPVQADYVLLCNNPKSSIAEIKNCFPGAVIIADNTCNYWNIKKMMKEANECRLKLHILTQQGSLIIDLNS